MLLHGMQGVRSSSLLGSTRFSASGTPQLEQVESKRIISLDGLLSFSLTRLDQTIEAGASLLSWCGDCQER